MRFNVSITEYGTPQKTVHISSRSATAALTQYTWVKGRRGHAQQRRQWPRIESEISTLTLQQIASQSTEAERSDAKTNV